MTTTQLPTLTPASFGFVHMSAGFKECFGDAAMPTARDLFRRFARNDWGTICEEDKQYNARDLASGLPCRLMGSYEIEGETVWVIGYIQHNPELQGDPDHCNTCVLLPADY